MSVRTNIELSLLWASIMLVIAVMINADAIARFLVERG